MTGKRKTWTEKFKTRTQPEVKRIDKKFADMEEGCLMLIATPQIIADYISELPEGSTADITTIRKDLAARFHAEKTCPVTTGIFLHIAAEKAYEDYTKGKKLKEITPFWRVIQPGSPMAKKLSFGQDLLTRMRKKEHID